MRKQLIVMWSLVLVTLLLAAARPFMGAGRAPSLSGTYEAFAHVFVGFLLGCWLAERWLGLADFRNNLTLALALMLIAVEVTVAVLARL